jgi:meso-butanediol dehydrogenase / (S,S)-butanediol dehydrogenase / diacetyl reductase
LDWQFVTSALGISIRNPLKGEKMSGRLSGKVAVVTGGASGIGQAACLRIANEGCHVAVVDIDGDGAKRVAEECAAAGVRALSLRSDVSDEKEIEAAVDSVLSHFKKLDLLVANAGIEGPMRDFGDITAAEFDRIMAVNVRGAFLTVRACIPTMRAQQSGAICMTASNYGQVATPHTTVYCATKGAVAALGRALAVELVPDGIRVNCVCPGNVDTPMFDRALAMQVENPAQVKAAAGRMAKPEEIASVIAFLLSEDAAYMTGAQVFVDYGETCRPGPVWPSPSW